MFDAEIQKAVDDYLEMERKARAFDLAVENFRNAGRETLVDYLRSLSAPPGEPAEKA